MSHFLAEQGVFVLTTTIYQDKKAPASQKIGNYPAVIRHVT